ncbi:MAG TPA: DUF1702 family protein [Blastocatellia bacterium]|nr:DUF1702 family protein [Blastocatellia bacterium]
MFYPLAKIRKSLLGVKPEEALCARRGFQVADANVRDRLELIGETFINGYNAALVDHRAEALTERLDRVTAELRGFAYEGAAMGLMLLDLLIPVGKTRWRSFINGPGDSHRYMMQVGAGWALAKIPASFQKSPAWLDPLLRWLTLDGFGFCRGYYQWQSFIQQRAVPKRLIGYSRRAFDQGLGRSIWFVKGADVESVAITVSKFPTPRHADLWSGIGLASAYAGGASRGALERLQATAKGFMSDLAQGAAFAAQARQRASNVTEHTDLACRVLCGVSSTAAARVTDIAAQRLDRPYTDTSYEAWRAGIRSHFIGIWNRRKQSALLDKPIAEINANAMG